MSSRVSYGILPLILAVFASACSEAGDSASGTEALTGPRAALMVAGCDVTALKQQAKVYFSPPEESPAVEAAEFVGIACNAGDEDATTAHALDLLSVVQAALASGNQGLPSDGNALVQEALGFATFDCVAGGTCSAALPDFTSSLSPGGAFGVVGSGAGAAPVIARGLTIGDTWVVEPGPGNTWLSSLGTRSVIFGSPASTPLALNESPLAPIQYEWNVIPDANAGFVQQLVVGVCDDPASIVGVRTVQRNSTLLEPTIPMACSTITTPAPFGERLLRLGSKLFGPQPLAATAQRGAGTGGRPTDFSTFAAVDATSTGLLVFVTQPDPVNVGGQPIGGPVRVQALTDSGTPVEHVKVRLTARVNNGKPVVISGHEAFTLEGGGIATFPTLTINKPGGYVLCAEAIQTDGIGGIEYSVAMGCSERLHVRNNGQGGT